MGQTSNLNQVSDDDLLRRLSELTQTSRRVEADVVAHIGEVDARKLYAREACSSMFDYCRQVLHAEAPGTAAAGATGARAPTPSGRSFHSLG